MIIGGVLLPVNKPAPPTLLGAFRRPVQQERFKTTAAKTQRTF